MQDNLPPASSRQVVAEPVRGEGGARVYRELRDAIVNGQFQPNQRLVEADLAALFGAGRTSVRAALATLDQEGLVIREPHRGAHVRLISDREALEIEQVRNALERLIARSAGTRATSADIDYLRTMVGAMAERVRDGDALGYSALNAQFHQRIWRIADHELATKLLGTLKSQSIRFQYRTMLRPGRTEQSLREHESIVAALATNDPDACEAAMAEHLRHVIETLQWAITTQHGRMPWSPR